MFSNRSVNVHQFSMIPRADVPRSSFDIQHAHKTTFDSGQLVPIYVDEVLPGDTFKFRMTAFARMATPLFPVMDNMYLDSHFFFVPNRLLWTNWKKFMGEQDNPGDSVSYIVPQCVCPAGGYAIGSLQDHMGLPTVGQVVGSNIVSHAALHTRAYNLVWNEWFRDENLQNSVPVDKDDGPDNPADYVLLRRGKRRDYFTSALPWPQKGSAVALPLGLSAPVYGNDKSVGMQMGSELYGMGASSTGALGAFANLYNANHGTAPIGEGSGRPTAAVSIGMSVANKPNVSGLYADLSTATAATINQIRQAFQIQRLLERDARGGTRYTEIVRSHFGVISPDSRLQRPEYLGGGTARIVVNPIAQTSATGNDGSDTPLGALGGMATAVANGHGFTQSFTEHGVILGVVSVRADLNYQQGMRKMWSRLTRYDFYFPVFANLGEQAILNREIYVTGTATDAGVFGYQERWGEYRYHPSLITGLFRSTAAGTIDGWHLAQRFTSLPALNATFVEDKPPLERVIAVGAEANGQQFIFDSLCTNRVVRPMPMYSVPGLIDQF